MSLDTGFSRGMRTEVRISTPAPSGQRATKPESITLTNTAAAVEGATELTLTASTATVLEANQILHFGDVSVVVTEQTAVDTATPVPVDGLEGVAGDGIPASIAEDETATWDGLHRVMGTSDSTLNITEGTNELSSVTYDSGQSMSWDETEITSKGWNMDRSGRFKSRDRAYRSVRQSALTGREVWLERTLTDEQGNPAQIERGRAVVTAFSAPAPAEGIVDASWTFTGQGQLEVIDVEAP